jgi:hypothetical protein
MMIIPARFVAMASSSTNGSAPLRGRNRFEHVVPAAMSMRWRWGHPVSRIDS